MDIKVDRIKTKSFRIQAQILHFNTYTLIWLNCYFPSDTQTLHFDDEELLVVQNEMENILDNNDFDDCVVGGDFNFDSRRTTGFANLMTDLLSRLGLKSA